MELSMEVLKSFAALTKDDPPKQEITLWGTAIVESGKPVSEGEEQQNLVTYVLLDGATDPTPVNQVAAVQNGDRVMVQIKNHKATIVGNATHPPDESKEIAEKALELAEEKKIIKIEMEYCLARERLIPEGSTFEDIQESDWGTVIPEYVSGKFYWTRQVTYWSDETITYGDPYFDMTNQVAAEAKITAATAKEAADTADGIAQEALEDANTKRRIFNSTPTPPYSVNDLWFDGTHGNTYLCKTSKSKEEAFSNSDWTLYSTDVSSHFWFDSSGAHVAEVSGDVSTGASQTISSKGTVMMMDGKLVTSWTMTQTGKAALNFYNGSHSSANTGDLMASYNTNGITLYINSYPSISITPSGILFTNPDDADDPTKQALFGPNGIILYKPDGVTIAAKIDTNGMKVIDGSVVIGNGYNAAGGAYLGANGLSVSNKFVVDSDGVLNCSGATVSGQLTAGDFSKIGNFVITGGFLYYSPNTSGYNYLEFSNLGLALSRNKGSIELRFESSDNTPVLRFASWNGSAYKETLKIYSDSVSGSGIESAESTLKITTKLATITITGGVYGFKANEFGLDNTASTGANNLHVQNANGSIGIHTHEGRGLYDYTNNCWLVCSSNNKDLVLGSAGITNAVHIRNALTYLRLGYETNCFYPNTDNATMLGTSNHRWASIYVKDTTVHGSDAKDKDILGDIDFANELIMSLKPCAYMWKDGDHRRKRLGFIAQETAETCKRIGENLALVTASYSSESKSKMDYFGEEVDDSELIWGMSYQELIAPMVAVIQRQELRIKRLENELEAFRKGA